MTISAKMDNVRDRTQKVHSDQTTMIDKSPNRAETALQSLQKGVKTRNNILESLH